MFSRPWKKYKITRFKPEFLDQRVEEISSRKGWYIRRSENKDNKAIIPNEVKYVYLSGNGREHDKYFISLIEFYTENLRGIYWNNPLIKDIDPLYLEKAIEIQIGREFQSCEQPQNPMKILVVEDSLFQQKLYKNRLKMFDVTTTNDISKVSKDYDLIFLSGKRYCELEIDHHYVIRYCALKQDGQSDDYIHGQLSEEKLYSAIDRYNI